MIESALLYLRLMVYPVVALIFYMRATFVFTFEKRHDKIDRWLFGALSVFFLALFAAALWRMTVGGPLVYDYATTPALVLVLAMSATSLLSMWPRPALDRHLQ